MCGLVTASADGEDTGAGLFLHLFGVVGVDFESRGNGLVACEGFDGEHIDFGFKEHGAVIMAQEVFGNVGAVREGSAEEGVPTSADFCVRERIAFGICEKVAVGERIEVDEEAGLRRDRDLTDTCFGFRSREIRLIVIGEGVLL